MKVYLESYEVEHMEEQAGSLRDKLLVRLLFRLGCRVSEALALKVGDIDVKQGMVTIKHLKSQIKLSCPQCNARLGRSHRFCPGCGARVDLRLIKEREHRRVRALPIDGDTLKMLAEFIGGRVIEDFIFTINRHRAWQIVRECAKRAGLPSPG